MQIFVKTWSGKTITIEVEPSDKIEAIKFPDREQGWCPLLGPETRLCWQDPL